MKGQFAMFAGLLILQSAVHGGVPFDVHDANRTLHFAWSAYCNETALRAWNCQWCTDAALSIEAYLKDTKAGTQGFVGIDEKLNRIVVAYRGSKNFANTVEDAKFWLTKAPFGPSEGKLDHGFLEAYLSVRNHTLDAVAKAKEQCANCSIIFTGHSLGAAMSTASKLLLVVRACTHWPLLIAYLIVYRRVLMCFIPSFITL